MAYTKTKNGFTVSDDRKRIDLDVVHGFLSTVYWSEGVPRKIVKRAVDGSMVFGLYEGDRQIGFCRVITDRATFAYLGDMFVLDGYRGRGLGTWLMQCIMEHPDLQGMRRWLLATRDAHALYRKFGFKELEDPRRIMQILDPDIYKKGAVARK